MGGSLFGLLDIAQSGLAAQTAGLDATGQNVANVNTAGYAEVTANLSTIATPSSFDGGVDVTGMSRTFSALTFGSMLTEQGLDGAADARSEALTQMESLVAPTSGTIGDDIDSFFSSVQTLESSPSDPSARAGVLGAASQLAATISETANGLSSQRTSLATQATGLAATLNQNLSQIAALNTQIAAARGSGDEPTNLEDQRDALASTVSTEIGAQVVTDANGDYTLLSSGTALVSNGTAATVNVALDSSNNLQITSTLGDGTPDVITSQVTSGTLGGIVEARDSDIPSVSSALDELAYNLSTSVNAIQSAGYGLDGVTGRNMFVQPTTVVGAAAAMAVDPSVANDPSAIAASSTASGLPGGNDNAVSLANLATEPLGTSDSPADAFGAIASTAGNLSASANDEQSLRDATVTQAQSLNSSVSGVSLSEQMTNLDQFQQAYEASSQVLQTANTMLSDLMTMMQDG